MAAENVEAGWITVHGQSQGHPDRLPAALREPYERSLIKKWEASDGHWSGIGKHPDFVESKKLHHKIVAPKDNLLGCGAYGSVEKVTYRSVCLARKWIKPRRNRTLEIIRAESHVMEKLDHEHIVKLIGTYTFRQRELYLLLWPVAVCNLSEILADIEYFRNGEGDGEDIRRLEALDLTDLRAIKSRNRDAAGNKCPLNFLQRIMGCVGQAVAYCHRAKIRHLDIKPTNILLNPERVYLADFGIARDVTDQERTTTIGHQGTPKWRAPEICDPEDWSMRAAEIYSLGLIYLNIATAVYNGNLSTFDTILEDPAPESRVEKLRNYQEQLAVEALATQQFHDSKAPTVTPRHILDLTKRMLSPEPASRPDAFQVDVELVDLGGIEQNCMADPQPGGDDERSGSAGVSAHRIPVSESVGPTTFPRLRVSVADPENPGHAAHVFVHILPPQLRDRYGNRADSAGTGSVRRAVESNIIHPAICHIGLVLAAHHQCGDGTKSWAAVAGEAKGSAKIIIGSPSKASAMLPPVATVATVAGRGRSRDRNLAGS
ncbi:hypothetical protein CkaCkLH20_01603 [Colletotrichum karsti]|uniref:Protein kinase domain-containing protein n=1 Tax=Colletotrichum karsti TaxID=1095194 RepID=A0A9P6LPM4_9PEZI|nr:uncharacterized protein CkaCkLH20_01603 [Colletotrichum karsti]KAF9880561.1 hypothetical protein CkaCkLH20_01603 [Colletotrichum karsti]